MLIWAFIKVPASEGLFKQHSTISGPAFSWAWLSALNSALGIYATVAVNIPDFTVSLSHVFMCSCWRYINIFSRDTPKMSEREAYIIYCDA
jgi:cytosine/uracil/thiamine/allantoin permease